MEPTEKCIKMADFRGSFGAMAHKDISPQYYSWKADNNPFGQGKIHLVERGVVIAGSASVTPKRIAVNGESVLAFEIGDTYTNPAHRRQGVFLEAVGHCTRYVVGCNAAFIYGTPNDASLPGYEKKADFCRIPDLRISLMTKYVSRKAITSRIAHRLGDGFHSRALTSILVAINWVRKHLFAGGKCVVAPVDVSSVPEDDGYWGDRTSYSFFTVRDKKFLLWRYFSNPDTYRVLMAKSASGPAGIVVTKKYTRDKASVGSVCDIVAKHDDSGIASSLLVAAEDELAAAGCDYLETWCASRSPYHKWLKRLGYVERTSFPVIVYRGSPLAGELMESKGSWHFTFGDSDNM